MQNNLAYNYKNQKEEKTVPHIKQIKTPKKQQTSVIKSMLYMAIVISMISFMLYCKAQQVELQSMYATTQRQIETAHAENTRLKVELESTMSLKNIEEIATKEYGLEKMNEQLIEYINFTQGDKAEVIKTQSTFDKIIEKVKSFFNF